ncbi:MAG TPA: heme NO-binding domain-containing protein [Ktedonobacterales bacterium]
MHGLIFVTWEKYLAEEFSPALLEKYRTLIGETWEQTPLTSRVYDDATLLKGVEAAVTLTRTSVESLLRGYGRYFVINGLTSRLCSYLLDQVHNARDLLLAMRTAHQQLGSVEASVTPPLFTYQTHADDPHGLNLLYNSPRQLCPLLLGAIEGAAARYHQEVWVFEASCMKRGAAVCRFEMQFSPPLEAAPAGRESAAQEQRQREQRQLAELVYSVLPDQDGMTLAALRDDLGKRQVSARNLRPYLLLEALFHLHHVGWVATTANQPGDMLENRRYWRLPRAF